jgi:hypothetical protein
LRARRWMGKEKVRINQLKRYKSYKELSRSVKIRQTDKEWDQTY